MPEQAVILCGGRGTRLSPFTDHMPKPMVPCNDRPFLKYLVEQLAEAGIRRFLLLTGYRGEQIEDYFGDGRQFGIEVKYSRGPAEWDTATRLWQARAALEARAASGHGQQGMGTNYRFVDVRYRDLVADPVETVERLYARLGLPVTAAYRANLASRVEEIAAKRRRRKLRPVIEKPSALEKYGLTAEAVYAEFGSYMDTHRDLL